MPLVVVGVLLLIAKMAELGPVADWSWWIVLSPFAGAVLWWHFADTTGWTQRRAMDKMEKRKADRRERAMEALGLDHKRERRVTRAREDAARLSSADPTQQPDAPPPPEAPQRREPRL
jgi:small Trp-rich protein